MAARQGRVKPVEHGRLHTGGEAAPHVVRTQPHQMFQLVIEKIPHAGAAPVEGRYLNADTHENLPFRGIVIRRDARGRTGPLAAGENTTLP